MSRSRFNRFLIVWAGQFVSGLGTGMTGFAGGIHIFSRSQSAAEFGFVIAALFVPGILLRPLGGLIADRFDRRATIVVGDLGSAASVLYLLFSLGTGALSPIQIYIAVACNSGFSALQNPAYKASVTDLLEDKEFAKAGGLMQLASSAQHLVSPLAAGMLLRFLGLRAVLLIDVATFLFAIAAVMAIGSRNNATSVNRTLFPPVPVKARWTTLGDQLTEGFRVLRSDPNVFATVALISAVTLFVGLLQTLFAPMVLLLTDAGTLGFIQSMSASGMLIASLMVGLVGLPLGSQRSLSYGLLVAGIALTLMGLRSNLVWITASFFVFFCCLPLVNTGAEVTIRKAIPNEFQGRAWGAIGLLSQAGYLVAYLFGGLVAETVFEPLLLPEGSFGRAFGTFWGTGAGRGIALMLSLSGIGLTIAAIAKAYRDSRCAALESIEGAYQS